MTTKDAADLAALMREAIMWAKILTAVSGCLGLPLLLWALDTSRQLYAVKGWQERHDDTLHDLKETRVSFAGIFKAIRVSEARVLDAVYKRRRP